jgi:hypothetical protein
MKQKTKAIIHGECIIFESKIPQDASLEEQDKSFVIIANSEVTGNHHVIDRPSNAVQFFTKDKKRYMRNSQPTNVRCVIADRHTSIPIPAGDWEIGIQQEYDYIAQVKRNVQD